MAVDDHPPHRLPQRAAVVRAADIVWRAARDRVLVRRIDRGDAAELVGLAAVVWVAADRPATVAALADELESDAADVGEAVGLLLRAGWLAEAPT